MKLQRSFEGQPIDTGANWSDGRTDMIVEPFVAWRGLTIPRV